MSAELEVINWIALGAVSGGGESGWSAKACVGVKLPVVGSARVCVGVKRTTTDRQACLDRFAGQSPKTIAETCGPKKNS